MSDLCPVCGADTHRRDPKTGWQLGHSEVDCLREQVADLKTEVESLRDELIDVLGTVVHCVGDLERTGPHAGWYCSNGRGEVVDAGERLVELGLWERWDDNTTSKVQNTTSKVQWYRPKEKA